MSDTPRVDFCCCLDCGRCHDLSKAPDPSTPLEEGTTP